MGFTKISWFWWWECKNLKFFAKIRPTLAIFHKIAFLKITQVRILSTIAIFLSNGGFLTKNGKISEKKSKIQKSTSNIL